MFTGHKHFGENLGMKNLNLGWASAFLGAGLLLALPACGDDTSAVDCDALGPHDEKPAECVNGDLGFGSAEGGEVRFEYMEFPATGCGDAADQPCGPGGRTTATRVVGYEMTAMTPDAMTFPNVGGCTSLVNGDTWPTGQGTGRTYADMGELTLTGGPSVLTVPAADAANPDPLGRSHDAYNFYFGTDDTDEYIKDNARYLVDWSGDADHPAHGGEIYMPGAYTLMEPAFANGVEVANTGDFTLTWGDEGNDLIPADTGPGMLSLVAFAIPGVGVSHLCVGPDTGTIVVPSDMVEEAATLAGDAGKATLLRGKLSHQLVEVLTNEGGTGRRIDMLGIYCYLNGITFVAP
jgi:hypothetical protein